MSVDEKIGEFGAIYGCADDSLRKLKKELREQREKIEDQIIVIKMKHEEEKR